MTMPIVYSVTYTVDAPKYSTEPTTGKVLIDPEFGTEFEDIRKILAISRGVQATQIRIHKVIDPISFMR